MTSILNPQLAARQDAGAVSPPSETERHPFAWVAFAAYATLYVAWTLLVDDAPRVSAPPLITIVGSLAFLPLNLGAVYWLFRAAGSAHVAAGERQALQYLGAMYICTAIGNTVWTVDESVRLVDARYSWANLFYVASYGLGIVGLSRFPVAPRIAMERRKFLLDAACVMLSMGALIWTFVVSSLAWSDFEPLHLGIELIYPVGSIVTLALLCRLLMRQGPHALRTDILLLAVGLFTQVVMDLLFELDYRSNLTRLTTWAALVCAVMYVVIIFAAQRVTTRKPAEVEGTAFPVLHPMNMLPTMAAISVYVVLLWAVQSGESRPLGVLVGTAIILNVLFLAKQTFAAQENAVLQAARADAESRARYEELAREGQRLESVGRLAGGLAHDFNNLLTTVLANSDFALTRLRPGQPAHEEVSDIRAAAMRGADLIRQLLAFSRKSVITPVRLQPDLVLRDMERLLQRLAGESNTLRLQLPADMGMVQVDRGQLEQVLANLVTNARDAMPDGGEIVISGRNVTLDAAAAALTLPAGPYVAIDVQDTGVGIAPEVREHIFEPFFSTKARGKGTGLGLASCYGILRQSNGGIAVESAVGQGSRFTLYLPRVEPVAKPTAPLPVPARNGTQGGRGEMILLIEDEAAVRQVTRRMLVLEGYEVLAAADAVAARALFEDHGSDIALVVSDVIMPVENGVALVASLRAQSPDLAVLFISGYSDAELPGIEKAAAADEFLQKPFTVTQLLSRIEARLAARRLTLPTAAHSR